MTATTREYRGSSSATNGSAVVEVWDDGALIGVLRHHVKHSPTGFSWGYGGSGPAELARCLLIDVLGDDAWCAVCAGADKDYETCGPCHGCFGERTSFQPMLYQAFKAQVIASMPEGRAWGIPAAEIAKWIEAHR